MKIKTAGIGVVALGLAALLTGCAEPPTADIDAAKQALEAARAAEADQYAGAALTQAEDAVASMDAEVKAQQDRFALFRSYDKAKELAAAAATAGQTASTEAAAGKERVKAEAEAKMAEAKTTLETVQQMLATAPRGKGTDADLAALKGDVDGLASTLTEVENAYAEGKYLDASTTAQSLLDNANRLKADIEQAIELSRSARRGRR